MNGFVEKLSTVKFETHKFKVRYLEVEVEGDRQERVEKYLNATITIVNGKFESCKIDLRGTYTYAEWNALSHIPQLIQKCLKGEEL